jgi:uncharacterized protein (DUF1501 family)
VESHIMQAAGRLSGDRALDVEFPATAFGTAARTAAQVIASGADVAAIKIALNGFDTHSAQQPTHVRLLKDLAEGLVALRSALVSVGRWDSALVVTYSEFGRRPRENLSGGTDHGTASTHLVLGGRVKGGLHGEPPQLARLDGNGNLAHAVDFRRLYATVLRRWWGIDPADALRGRYETLDLIRA